MQLQFSYKIKCAARKKAIVKKDEGGSQEMAVVVAKKWL